MNMSTTIALLCLFTLNGATHERTYFAHEVALTGTTDPVAQCKGLSIDDDTDFGGAIVRAIRVKGGAR
jgi:hypothetical protein